MQSARAGGATRYNCGRRLRPRALDIELNAAIEEAAKKRRFSGVVLVASDDRIVAHRSAGFADAAGSKQISEESRFVIGSLSKQITAALVMREVEAGRLQLEAPIARYLPLKVPAAVEVRHLLNHTAGIKALDQPLAREPGTLFEYSNLGYDLLGQLVEHTSGQPFSEAVNRLLAGCGSLGAGRLESNNESSLAVGFGESPEGALTPLPLPLEVKEHLPSGGIVASAGKFLNGLAACAPGAQSRRTVFRPWPLRRRRAITAGES